MKKSFKVLIIGDVVGRPGRNICKQIVPQIQKEESLDFVIINGENIAGGSGITERTAKELFDLGGNVITSGDHIFKSKNTDKSLISFFIFEIFEVKNKILIKKFLIL